MNAMQRRLLAVVLAQGAGAACVPVDNAVDAGTVDAVDGGVDRVDGGVEEDLTRDPSCPLDVAWVTEVSGRVVGESATGLSDTLVQLCARTNVGRLLCLRPTTSSADGAFVVDVVANARCMERATMRVVKPLTDTTTSYCSVPLSTETSTIALSEPYAVLTTTRATTLPAAGDVDAVREVVYADGLSLDVVPSTLPTDTYERLAARVLTDVNAAPACVRDGAPAMSAVVGFSPELEVAGAGLTARVPNTSNLAAGTAVPMYALGSIDCRDANGTLLEEGHWEHFADGVVSADGSSIEVAGVPCLTWLGTGTP